ncbi:MAG: nucleotide exchange factor GrpE [Rickettsiales bacterium]|nr:nucleotide exchange factor GrpE [Rickettsiales bacterium]|tara:strand:+ start:343 stop:972 length:630 start_codon:yes stop_codon:yes gene_type:complete
MNQPENESPQTQEETEEHDKVVELARQAMSEDEAAFDLSENPESIRAEYEAQLAEMKDQLIRAVAETENVRKRAQRDQEETNKYAVTGFARSMVAVLENLQRATTSIPDDLRNENQQVKNLAEGVEMTMRELLNAFSKFGISKIEPQKGEKFDHNMHQAMSQIEDPDAEPNSILHVMQAGYTIHDRLLQPAMVVVAKRGEPVKNVDTEA